MADERIEDYLRGTRASGASGGCDVIDLCDQREHAGRRCRARQDGNSGHRAIDTRGAFGPRCFELPVASHEQLLNGLLAHVIELANRQEKIRIQAPVIEFGERERRFAETSQLLSQYGTVERPIRGWSQLSFAPHIHRLTVADEEQFEM